MLNFLVLPLATIPTVRKHTYIYIYIIVKEEHEHKAKVLFADTNAHVTINGKSHLGAALGAKSFTEEYVSSKVTKWTKEIIQLSMIPLLNPMQPMLPLLMVFPITGSTPVELFQISNICSSLWRLPFTNTSSLHSLDENLAQWLNEICWPSLSDWVEWGWLTPCPTQPTPLKDRSISPDCAVERPSKREKTL